MKSKRESCLIQTQEDINRSNEFRIFSSSKSPRKSVVLQSRSLGRNSSQKEKDQLNTTTTTRNKFVLYAQYTKKKISQNDKDAQKEWRTPKLILSQQLEKQENKYGLNEQVDVQKDFQQMLTNVFCTIEQIISARAYDSSTELKLQSILTEANASRNIYLVSYVHLKLGKIAFHRNQYIKAVLSFKMTKNSIYLEKGIRLRLKSYYWLSMTMNQMKEYKLAILYANKMLQSAWACNDKKAELKAYELHGLNYYYTLDMQRARFYHYRSVNGQLEERTSEFRKLGIKKVKRQLQSRVITQQSHKIKINKKDNVVNKIHIFPIITEFIVSSSDEELVQFSVTHTNEESNSASYGTIKRALQQQHLSIEESNTGLIQQNMRKNLFRRHNNYIKYENVQAKESFCDPLAQFTAEQTTPRGKIYRKCNILSNINSTVTFSHHSCNREPSNYESLNSIQMRNNDEVRDNSFKNTIHGISMMSKVLQKLRKSLVMCMFKLNEEGQNVKQTPTMGDYYAM